MTLQLTNLIKHIQRIESSMISLQIAETKQREYQKNKQPDAIEFSIRLKATFHQVSSTLNSLPKDQNNDSDFDSSNGNQTRSQSFDDLQSGYVATPTEEVKPDIEPLKVVSNL